MLKYGTGYKYLILKTYLSKGNMRKDSFVIFGLHLLVVVGCSKNVSDTQVLNMTHEAAARNLKDSESARFSDEYILRGQPSPIAPQDIFICGRMDGKNSFGAYTGGSRYVATMFYSADTNVVGLPSVIVEAPEEMIATMETSHTTKKESIFESVYWNRKCVDDAHPATYTGTHKEP